MSQYGNNFFFKCEQWSHGCHGKDNKPEHVLVFLGEAADEKY